MAENGMAGWRERHRMAANLCREVDKAAALLETSKRSTDKEENLCSDGNRLHLPLSHWGC